jgi:hypothetical protein
VWKGIRRSGFALEVLGATLVLLVPPVPLAPPVSCVDILKGGSRLGSNRN